MVFTNLHHRIVRTAFVSLLAGCLMCTGSALADVPIGPGVNQVSNPGFESGTTGWSFYYSATDCQAVSDQVHSGLKSLRFTKTVNNEFRSANYHLPLVNGCRCRFSAWVKTSGLSATWESLHAYIRCFDSSNTAIATWETMVVIKGTEWTLLSGESGVIPRDAVRVDLTFFMTPACTGTLWVDDVFVEAIDDVISSVVFKNPGYRNTLYPGQSRKVSVAVQITDSVRHPLSNLALDAVVLDAAGKAVARVRDIPQAGKSWENIGINLQDADPGAYQVVIKATDKSTNQEISRRTLPLTIAAPTTPLPKVHIDENNRFVVDGKLYFPLGFYIHQPSNQLLDIMAAGKFNTGLTYNMPGDEAQIRAYFAAATQRNIKLLFPIHKFYDGVGISYSAAWGNHTGIANVTTAYVNTFKGESALLGWYLGEDMNEAAVPQIKRQYDLVKSLDSDHPVAVAFSNGDTARFLAQCSDTVGLYTYPVMDAGTGTPDLTRFGNLMTKAWNATLGAHALWMVPECSSQTEYKADSRAPRYDEMMCEAYQALVGGARGLIFYYLFNTVNHDGSPQIDLVKRVGVELNAISSIALALDAEPAKRVQATDSRIKVCTRQVGSDLYALAVNPTNSAISAGFRVGAGSAVSRVEVGLPGATTSTLLVSSGTFSQNLEARGVRVYRLLP